MSKKQLYLCVDLTTLMKQKDLQVNNQANGLLRREDEDHFVFTEQNAKPHEDHPELRWRLLDRTKHGRAHINSRHVKVEFYVHHDDYQNGRELADILASEIETMGEALSDMCLEEEVEKCHC